MTATDTTARDTGRFIKVARHQRHLSQEQLAGRVGCSLASISHYETGHSRVPTAMLERIARVLEVEVGRLEVGGGKE